VLAGSRCGVSLERWSRTVDGARELWRNRDRRGEYRATSAHALAWQRAGRPKPVKLWVNQRLREIVEDLLERRYSPEQIAGRLRVKFSADREMWVSGETIHQSLYVTSRGALRRELTKCLRTGRKAASPRPQSQRAQRSS
jgi:IS30 family transposase